jgi:hypothetical protein
VVLTLKGTHQLLFYADDVNLLGNNIDITMRNTETAIEASKKVGLEVNAEKTDYMLMSHHQNAAENHNMKTVNRSFENVACFKYLETTVRNQSLIQEVLKRRLNSDDA